MKRLLTSGHVAFLLTLVWLTVVISLSRPVYATTDWYVAITGSDSNDCQSSSTPCATINRAIEKAAPGDMIRVMTGVYTVSTGSEVVLINKSITLSGGWNGAFAVQDGQSIIDAQAARRGIMIGSGKSVSIDHFVIQNGYDYYMSGGGLYNQGILTLTQSVVTGSVLHSMGIENLGKMTIDQSAIVRNSGYGIANNSLNDLGHVTLVIKNSVISENTGNGIIGGGVANDFGVITMTNVTVSRNSSTGSVIRSGGIDNNSGAVSIDNSTIAQNVSSAAASGIGNHTGTVLVNSSTVAQNVSTYGGSGIDNDWGTVTLQNTILSENKANAVSSDCHGTINSGGYNLLGDISNCSYIVSTGDLTNTKAQLGPLVGIPGTPQYYPLMSGSPAIDAGNPAGCSGNAGPLSTDQRGAYRVGRCDIGAYEYTVPGPAATIYSFSGTPQRAPVFSIFSLPLQTMVLDSIGTPVSNTLIVFSAPKTGASGLFTDTGTYSTTTLSAESGIAAAAAFKANELAGSYTVTATVDSIAISANFFLDNFVQIYLPIVARILPGGSVLAGVGGLQHSILKGK